MSVQGAGGQAGEADSAESAEVRAQDKPRWTRENRIRANRNLLEALALLWDEYPDQRFGQLVMNLSRVDGGFLDTWHWNHQRWFEAIGETSEQWAFARRVSGANQNETDDG